MNLLLQVFEGGLTGVFTLQRVPMFAVVSFYLCIAYQDGNGVDRSDAAAAHWFGLAATQGHRAAQYALAGMYEEGEGGLRKDPAKARQLYLLSANQGYYKAQMEVGFAYEV